MSDPVIHLDDISLRVPGALILRSVTLTLSPGSTVALFGANGSGKTTLLRILATLVAPTGGRGRVLGADLGTGGIDEIRPRIGLIGHESALFGGLTLAENLRLVERLSGAERGSSDRALAAVGLAGVSDRLADRCSNGMRRRAEFARMLVTRPTLLLLDEAHVGLDREAGALVEDVVRSVTERGGAAVVVSHERERVAAITARSVELSDGVIEAAA